MALRKNFTMGKGNYYFTVKSIPNNITIYRKTKEAAAQTYRNYIKVGKDCEWLGKWDGKKFTESSPPA
ncbi:MAG: hypothetical protein AAF798_23030 [Bacteroidota bacterium]